MGVAIKRWLGAFAPAPVGVNTREKLYGAVGALVGLFCTEWVGHHALGSANPWFIAPMGASAVLLFAAPASPLAQPWSIMAGNFVSALIGVFCAQSIADPGVAAATAAALAIATMFWLRCLHPPSGAVALTAVLGGPQVAALGYGFALWPVALNSAILLSIAVVFNGLLKRNYPRRHAEPATNHQTRDPAPSARLGFSRADLDQALAQRGELLDISKEDLEEIVLAAELRASRRRFGDVRCADIMSRDVVSVQQQDPLDYAVRLFDKHRLQWLPVLDSAGHYAGMLAQGDVLARRRPAGGRLHALGSAVRPPRPARDRTGPPHVRQPALRAGAGRGPRAGRPGDPIRPGGRAAPDGAVGRFPDRARHRRQRPPGRLKRRRPPP